MKKWQINFVIDALLFLILAFMVGQGFLVKYVLLPGAESIERFGVNYQFHWLGLDRHQWGTIHLILGISFVVLVVVHIFLHWKVVKNMLCCLIPKKNLRVGIVIAFLLFSLIGLLFWTAANPARTTIGGRGRNASQNY